ncbi:MAG: hypothetical protein OQL09_00405, partial [Gammaproteobacteria bacterium]|nr:hypothetical protein [Gammaproteobacteria bacterium]
MIKQSRFLCLILLTSFHSLGTANTDMYCTLMDPENDKCHIQTMTLSYTLDAEGVLIREKDHKKTIFSLPESHHIETVQFKPFNNKIIFTFSVSDGDSGSTLVSLFDEEKYN